MQVLEDRLEDGFAVLLVITEMGNQEGDTGVFVVVVAVQGVVLHWVQEEADVRGSQGFQGDSGSVGLHCRDGVVVETIDDSRERMIITGYKEVLFLHG